jgi:hypothetical protein
MIGCAWVIAVVCAALQVFAAPALAATDRQAMMRLIVDRWIESQLPDGALPYGFDFLADKETGPAGKPWENIVRQAGSFYMWAKYYEYSRDGRLQEPIQRALSALGERSLPIGKSRTQQWLEETRILSLPIARWKLNRALNRLGLLYRHAGPGKVVTAERTYATAFTGATPLAILAELAYSRASGDDRFTSLRSAWLDGLLSLHIPGGGFRQSPDSIDETEYYTGEAWFALAVYCQQYAADARCTSLEDLDAVLLHRYSNTTSMNFFHWGAMSAAQRFRTTNDRRFLVFLQRQSQMFFSRLEPRLVADDNNCGVMEGLAAMLPVLEQVRDAYAPMAQRMRTWLAKEADKLPRLQIQVGQNALPLGGNAYLTAPRLAAFSGAFLLGLYRPNVQVDAAAHCLSAMVMIERDRVLSPAQ